MIDGQDFPYCYFLKLRGQIERITFVNEENGFTTAKMKFPGGKDPGTVVGSLVILLTKTLARGQK